MNDAWVLTNIAIGLGILLWLWVGPMATLRKDEFRSEIRRIRDDLFDFMWKNNLSYDNESYRGVRQLLNGLLRWSNHVSPITFVISLVMFRNSTSTFSVEQEPNAILRLKLRSTVDLACSRFMRFVFLTGTWGLFFKFLLLPLKCFNLFEKLRRWVGTTAQQLLLDAYALGQPMLPQPLALLVGVRTVSDSVVKV